MANKKRAAHHAAAIRRREQAPPAKPEAPTLLLHVGVALTAMDPVTSQSYRARILRTAKRGASSGSAVSIPLLVTSVIQIAQGALPRPLTRKLDLLGDIVVMSSIADRDLQAESHPPLIKNP
jgi:hypothetical protein